MRKLPGTKPHRKNQRGFLLPLVILISFVLLMFFATMSFMTRGQTNVATHFLESSKALILAESGAEWALTSLASGVFQPAGTSSIEPHFFEAVFGTAEGDFGEFQMQPPTVITDYTNELSGTIEVRAKLHNLRRLPCTVPGFNPDPIEKEGELEIISIGTVGRASRRVRLRKGIKIYLSVHPVLSKFTLFVRTKAPDSAINSLQCRSLSGFTNGTPLVLNNQGPGKTVPIVDPASQRIDFAPFSSSVPDFVTLAAKSGWIFLNSETAPWVLNLAGSSNSGEFDDRALLRFGTYARGDLKQTLQNPPPLNGSTIQTYIERFEGMKLDYKIKQRNGSTMVKDIGTYLNTRFYFPSAGVPASASASLLRPFGTNYAFSPTAIFGPVHRRFFRQRAIDCTLVGDSTVNVQNAGVPGFPDKNTFEQAFRSPIPDYVNDFQYFGYLWGFDRMVPAQIGPGWDRFEETMTQLVSEPFLESLNFLFVPEKEGGTVSSPSGTRFEQMPSDRVQHTDFFQGANSYVQKSLLAAEGTFGPAAKPFYTGPLAAIEGLEEWEPKVTQVHANTTAFFSTMVDSTTTPQRLTRHGVIFAGDNDLIISQDLVAERGGTIISGGNIRIRAKIQSPQSPLTLVAKGNITIETTQPVEAHLICLRGTFSADSAFSIVGGVAAKSIDLAGMKNSHSKKITWVPDHDPQTHTDPLQPNGLYRFALSESESYLIEPGE